MKSCIGVVFFPPIISFFLLIVIVFKILKSQKQNVFVKIVLQNLPSSFCPSSFLLRHLGDGDANFPA